MSEEGIQDGAPAHWGEGEERVFFFELLSHSIAQLSLSHLILTLTGTLQGYRLVMGASLRH